MGGKNQHKMPESGSISGCINGCERGFPIVGHPPVTCRPVPRRKEG